MTPEIETAWIAVVGAAGGGLIGVFGALGGAWIGKRTAKETNDATIAANSTDIKAQIDASAAVTRAQIQAATAQVLAQIEADRNNRIWDKRAAVYAELIRGIRHQQGIRATQVIHVLTGQDASTEPSTVDWPKVEAEGIAYGSSKVLDALVAASDAGRQFRGDYNALEGMEAGSGRGELANKVRAEAAAATALDDKVLDIIRIELQARPGSDPLPPLPRGRLSIDN
jgi:hypothetical protein